MKTAHGDEILQGFFLLGFRFHKSGLCLLIFRTLKKCLCLDKGTPTEHIWTRRKLEQKDDDKTKSMGKLGFYGKICPVGQRL